MNAQRLIHLTAGDVSVVLVSSDHALPVIAHWGPRIRATDDDLVAFWDAEHRPGLEGVSDVPYRPSLLPEHGAAWFGHPGFEAHRAGAAWAPRFVVRSVEIDGGEMTRAVVQTGPARVAFTAHDEWAAVELEIDLELSPEGLLRVRSSVRNGAASGEPLEIQGMTLALSIPTRASELLDFAGRWGHERLPQRHPVVRGAHVRDSRRGRTGLDATTILAAGVPGFSSDAGEVWLGHVGFSGNHHHALERGDATLAFRGGELLLPGEVRLAPGEAYETPWVYGSYGDGLDTASARFHAHLRRRSRSRLRPRPITLNVWEAVYFDQDPETIFELAQEAAALGVERFVLDDGWFRNRRDDRAGLGDWTPDLEVWPEGLAPLADAVRELGMEFGVWVEPEMVNEDSDLARAHPDWILRARPELPALFRFQQVLDLTNPEAYAHILDALDQLVRDTGAAYVKWDHNRDLIAAGHPASGGAAVHEQTLAVYRLFDELRERHPALEIESCASGGGRIDLGILERADRVHPSDNHDPFDRFQLLRWTGLLVPPEMLGSHVASPTSSVTGRTHDLHFRCAIAFLGHFGIEWDIRGLPDDERATLRHWIALFRRFRGTIATGRHVGGGETDPMAPSLRGVVAADHSEALYTIVAPPTAADTRTRVRLVGLHDERRYRISADLPASLGPPWQVPDWLREAAALGDETGARVMSGAMLRDVGLEFPTFHPDRAVVVHASAVS